MQTVTFETVPSNNIISSFLDIETKNGMFFRFGCQTVTDQIVSFAFFADFLLGHVRKVMNLRKQVVYQFRCGCLLQETLGSSRAFIRQSSSTK